MAEARDEMRTAAPEIAAILAADIRSGIIAVDAPLPTERALCERFGVSRPTVREALVSLQIRGFVSAGNGKRPRAARPSLAMILREASGHIRDALGDTETGAYLEQMRQFMEAGAVREAAQRATSVEIARLKAALDANFAAIGTPEFSGTDIAFHRALVAVLNNPVVDALHQMYLAQALALRPPAADRLAADRATFAEHHAVFQALLDGDAERASDQLDQHLSRSYRKRMAFSGRAASGAAELSDEPMAEPVASQPAPPRDL